MAEIASQLPTGSQVPIGTKLNVKSRSPWQEAWERFLKNKASLLGLVIVILFLLLMVSASLVLSYPRPLGAGYSF